jgi:signal transduction histidine kinase
MQETFPTTPRASSSVRLGAIVLGLAAIVLATRATITSRAWVGRVFPGFMILDNRVVASVGLAHWSGTAVPGLYQSEVVAVDGEEMTSTPEIYARVAALRPGTVVRYRLKHAGTEREVRVAAQRFTDRDWVLLFGAFLLNGVMSVTTGLVVWVLRPRMPAARALCATGISAGLFLLSAMDLYGPATLFRLHVVGESFLPAALFQLAMVFPDAHRHARWRLAGYPVALVTLAVYEWSLYRPWLYSHVLTLNMLYLGLVGIFSTVRLVASYRSRRSPLARQRARVLTVGALFGLSLPLFIVLASAISGGGTAMNPAAMTIFLFLLALAYGVVKHDLFEIDAMVKRGAYYLFLTGAVGATYIGAVVLFNLGLRAGAVTDSPAFPVLFTFAVLLLFNPLRTRLQAFVDRTFFGTRYDAPKVLAEVGAELASALQREQIAAILQRSIAEAIPNAGTRLYVPSEGALREVGGRKTVPSALQPRLRMGRIVTVYDPVELYPDGAAQEAARAGLATLEAEIAVPLLLRGELVGVLGAGPKRSRFFYTAADAEFLRALVNQAAIALENAASYEALAALNARLEERVRERTAQLESTNRELADAYAELKQTEVQLVQSEKMASLGRLVAGVAHEINNPVTFIASSIPPLRQRLAQAAAAAPPSAAKALREAEDLVGIMARGAERTAAIVKDLRSFSRLGEATRKPADLQEGLEVSLRLLESRWRDRITIHRDFGPLPLVECDPAQLNQVFMNLLANACDAIAGAGNIWVTTRVEGDAVVIAIRDDGSGMPPELLDRIFDPFFTTKDVGAGTGLGLAISLSVVSAHGGQLDVESAPGRGTTFRIVLPGAAAGGQLDRAVGGTR